MMSQLQTLMQNMETCKQDLKKAEGVNLALKEEEKRLIQTGELIKGAEKRFNQEFNDHDRRYKSDQEDIAKYKAHGCGGSNLSQEMTRFCNEWRNRENPNTERLKDERKTFVERNKAITESREGLNKAVNEWAKKKKENNANLNDLIAKYQQMVSTVRFLTMSPHYRQLIQKAGASGECANIQGVEILEMYKSTGEIQLEGAAEKAHRCLQRIWDGAK
jgi:methyl-accepting chemotaxis protein